MADRRTVLPSLTSGWSATRAAGPDEILLQEVGEDLARTEVAPSIASSARPTLVVHPRRDDRPPFVIGDIRPRARRLAAVLELLAADPQRPMPTRLGAAHRVGRPAARRRPGLPARQSAAVAAVLLAIIAAGDWPFRGQPFHDDLRQATMRIPPGRGKSGADGRGFARFMDHEVMPWGAPNARTDRRRRGITSPCEDLPRQRTPEGPPAGRCRRSAALPEPLVRRGGGFEIYSAAMDSQMRKRDLRLQRRAPTTPRGRPTCAKWCCPAWRRCSIGPPTTSTRQLRAQPIAECARVLSLS